MSVQTVGVEIDTLQELHPIDRDRECHDLDLESVHQLGRDLAVGIGHQSDHRTHRPIVSGQCTRGDAAANRCTITAVLIAAATGSAAVGFGPQKFGHPRRHHTTPPSTQHNDETVVAANARCFHLGFEAVSTAPDHLRG